MITGGESAVLIHTLADFSIRNGSWFTWSAVNTCILPDQMRWVLYHRLCLGNPLRWVGRGNSNGNRLRHHQGKGYRFQHRDRFHEFAEKGWAFGDEAAASAKSDDKGAAAESEVSFVQGIGIYPLTDAGVMARAMVSGTKYWQDEDLH